MISLFDTIGGTDDEFARYAEPSFVYMNRSSRSEFIEVRKKLDSWFRHYPKDQRDDLRARFRSHTNSQHESALFELILHEVLRGMGCKITLHPTLQTTTKNPDFLVQPQGSDPFFVEAVVVTNESKKEASAQARINQVYDVLDRKVNSSNFFLWLSVEGAPASPPQANKIALFLNERLEKLDPDHIAALSESGGIEAVPVWRYEHDGWVINFRPLPKKPVARNKKIVRPIGATSTDIRWIDNRTPLRDAIKTKAKKYGELELPYVVAVNALEFIDDIDIMEALFGKEQFEIDVHHPDRAQMSRALDGVWISYDGPQYTRVSAVMLSTRLSPWNLWGNVRLYHNPWAKKVYSAALTRLPQAVLVNHHMRNVDGDKIGTILGLPGSWPKTN